MRQASAWIGRFLRSLDHRQFVVGRNFFFHLMMFLHHRFFGLHSSICVDTRALCQELRLVNYQCFLVALYRLIQEMQSLNNVFYFFLHLCFLFWHFGLRLLAHMLSFALFLFRFVSAGMLDFGRQRNMMRNQ